MSFAVTTANEVTADATGARAKGNTVLLVLIGSFRRVNTLLPQRFSAFVENPSTRSKTLNEHTRTMTGKLNIVRVRACSSR